MTRKDAFVEGEYYHIFLRGNLKQDIFFDDSDRWRFIMLMFLLQSLTPFSQDTSVLSSEFRLKFSSKGGTKFSNELNDLIASAVAVRKVEVCSFILMPNHFHFLLGCTKDDAISKYMQRTKNANSPFIRILVG